MIRVNGGDFPWTDGLTVADIIKQKNYTYPALLVAVNGRHVDETDYGSVAVADGADIKIIHMIAGG